MIKAEDLAKYLGKGDEALALAKRAVEVVRSVAVNRCVEATAAITRENGTIKVVNTVLTLPGKDMEKLLEGCDAVYYFCATVGIEVDREIERLKLSDLTLAYAADLCAGLWVDAYCDELEKRQRERLAEKGLTLTGRFSCGYGDLPLSLQAEFIEALKADKFLGIRLTAGGMMIPSKSVSAVAGIGGTAKKMRNCDVCAKRGSCDGGLCGD